MIDSKILKENPISIKEMLSKRNIDMPIDELIYIDKKRRLVKIELQNLYHDKNLIAKDISIKRKNNTNTDEQIEKMNEIGSKIKKIEEETKIIDDGYKKIYSIIPNFFHNSVPIGMNENDNIIIKFFSKNYSLDNINLRFDNTQDIQEKINKNIPSQKIKNHIEIANELDLLDLERAGKIAGTRFFFLKNDLVKLGLALTNFAIDYLIEKDYTIIQPPYMIKKEAMEGAVILNDFEDTIYKIEGEDLYMIGTSEHSLASMHMNEILDGKKLPLRYAGTSPCFRKEAGAHGKDMKGIFRVHQFEKVEQFVFVNPKESWDEHQRLLETTEKFYEILEIPFRTIVLCSGDLGKVSAKTYDIEAWFPAQNTYREICSCSNCTRLSI